MNFDFNISNWNWRIKTPADTAMFTSMLQRIQSRENKEYTGGSSYDQFLELLNNRNFSTDHFRAWDQLESQDFFVPPEDRADINEMNTIFPDYIGSDTHMGGLAVISAITGVDIYYLATQSPDHGLTGTPGIILTQADDPNIALGSVKHDNSSFIDYASKNRAERDLAYEEEITDLESMNTILYKSANVQISALVMAAEAYFKSLTEGIIPPEEDLLNFLGMTEQEFLRIAGTEIPYYQTVTNLGNTGANLASKLAYFHADQGFATQLIAQSASKTVGGYLGDYVNFELAGLSLPASTVFTRVYSNIFQTTSGFASSALAEVIDSTFDIEDPLGQFVTTTISSSLVNVATTELLKGYGIDKNTAELYLGLEDLRLEFDLDTVNGEILNVFGNGLQSFAIGQAFSYLDQSWDNVDLANEGSALGGVIGSFIAPGIGSFVGQVVGGLVFDLVLDEDPRSFHSVYYDTTDEKFVSVFSFSADGGKVEISESLGGTAKEIIELVSLIVGGDSITIQTYDYGHYEEDLTYDAGSGRVTFDDGEEMLREGILSQLRTYQVKGGNEYAKDLLVRSNYDPSLETFLKDINTAREYDIHKADPFLYGTAIINIEDISSKEFLLNDWNNILGDAHKLGFNLLPINDGGEFMVRINGTNTLDGGAGDDFLYYYGGSGSLHGGDGDDKIRADSILLNGGNTGISGGEGFDTFVGDFSNFQTETDNAQSDGIMIGIDRYLSGGGDAGADANFDNIEQLDVIGTRYNDSFTITNNVNHFDGGDGYDTLSANLNAATSDIEFDLSNTENQLIYGSAVVKNFENISSISLGSGNDVIKVDSVLLEDTRNNGISGGEGFDTFVGDFSNFQTETDNAQSDGIMIGIDRYLSGGGDAGADANFDNIEQLDVIGTRYNDSFTITNNVNHFDGGDGYDTLSANLNAATSDIEFDLSNTENQLIYGSAVVKNFENISSISLGSGNDVIKVDSVLLEDTRNNGISGGEGFDTFVGDFSNFQTETDNAQSDGIMIGIDRYLSGGGDAGADANFDNIEQLDVIGTRYNDSLAGGINNDQFSGSAGNDELIGNGGDDRLDGGAGNDTLNGGADDDVALYTNAYAGYVILGSVSSLSVEDTLGNEGTDTLYQVETLRFADGVYDVASGVFTPITPTNPVEMIVDNQDGSQTSTTGSWTSSSGVGSHEGNSVYANANGESFTWNPDLGADSEYDISAWWTYWSNRDTSVTYEVHHVNGVTNIEVNQRDQALDSQWNSLGSYTLDQSSFVRVVHDGGTATTTSADAVRFSPAAVGNNTAPIAVDDAAVTDEDVAVSDNVLGNDTDADGDTLNITAGVIASIQGGSVTLLTNGDYSYTPAAGFFGADSFDYTVNDGNGGSDIGTVNITVNEAAVSPDPIEVIVDNQDGSQISLTGSWTSSSGTGPHAGNSVYANTNGESFTWNPDLSADSEYEITAWWTYWSNRDTSVTYEVHHVGGVANIELNQRDQALDSQWNSLGSYTLDQSSFVRVVHDGGSATTTSADALRFSPAAPPVPVEVIVDNQDEAQTSTTGSWTSSSGTGPHAGNSVFANANGESFTWNPDLSADSEYEITAWWTYWSNRDTSVTYEVHHVGGVANIELNQRDQALDSQWNSLGSYTLDQSSFVRVVHDGGTSTTTSADALRFSPVIESTALAAIEEVEENIINGDIENNVLYGTFGVDRFVFEVASAFDSIYTIANFNVTEGDRLDISDLLAGYDPSSNAIEAFVQITDNGTDSYVAVDTDGSTENYVQIATLIGVSGLGNEDALELSGHLITG